MAMYKAEDNIKDLYKTKFNKTSGIEGFLQNETKNLTAATFKNIPKKINALEYFLDKSSKYAEDFAEAFRSSLESPKMAFFNKEDKSFLTIDEEGNETTNPIFKSGYSKKTNDISKLGTGNSIEVSSEKKEDKSVNIFEKILGATLTQTLGFSSVIGFVVKILELLSGGPFKAILSMLNSIFQIVLLPVGMLLLTLFKPVMIMGLKMSMKFLEWMQTADAKRLMLLFEGIGEILASMLVISSNSLVLLGAVVQGLVIGFTTLVNVMGNIFSGNFQGAADASAAGNSAMGDLILTTAITFADNMETGYELMASGIGKIGVAIDGSDGLVESLSGAAPKEAIDLLSNVISDPFTEEGEATKAMAGIAIAFDAGATQFGKISDSLTTTKDGIVSGGNSILTAFSSVATAIANADLLGMIIDAVLERIVPTPKTVNKIGEGGGSGDYGGGHAGGGAGARGGVMTLLSVGGTSTLIE